MPGERYFATRDQLAGIAGQIQRLADEVGLAVPEHDPVPDLHRPVRLAAVGEVNAGKSSLLNALAGASLCPAGPVPLTSKIMRYVHGGVVEDVEIGGGGMVCRRPAEFLRNYELIDFPGANVMTREQQEQSWALLESCDAVLVVFTAENPWTAATWRVVEGLSDEALGRTLLMVQRMDLKQAEDLPVILGHMKDLCLKRVGRELPIFPVSAKAAMEAKGSTGGAAEAWSASRFAAWESYLTERVCESFARRELLHEAWHHGARMLNRIEDHLDQQSRGFENELWFLQTMERELEQARDEVVSAAPRLLSVMKEVYRDEVDQQIRGLSRRLGWLGTATRLMTGDASAGRAEAAFTAGLERRVKEFGVLEVGRLIQGGEKVWEALRGKVKERMALDLGASGMEGDYRRGVEERFVARMVKGVPQAVAQLGVRGLLDPLLRRRNGRMKGVLILSFGVLAMAGLFGTMGWDGVGFWLLSVGGGFLTFSMVMAWWTRRYLLQGYRTRLEDSAGSFGAALEADYGDAVRSLYREYSHGLMEVRRRLAEQKASLQPRLQRWNDLFLGLKAVELEI